MRALCDQSLADPSCLERQQNVVCEEELGKREGKSETDVCKDTKNGGITRTIEKPAMAKPTIPSAQRPCCSVSFNIRLDRMGSNSGFDMCEHVQSKFRNVMAFSFVRSMIEGVLERIGQCDTWHADKTHRSYAGGP